MLVLTGLSWLAVVLLIQYNEYKERFIMSTRSLITDEEASPEVLAVFEDIRKTRGSDFINNFWRALAHDPKQLKAIWGELKLVMGPGTIDPITKEMIYIAVSVANGCSYCIHSHTAAAKAKGMSEAQHSELVSIIGMAGKTNHLVTALQVPVDDAFKV
jgi:AhpD family alkylhydroperoxidase